MLKGNMATAFGAKLCRPNVIPAYPITPSTLFPEKISEFIADGELDSEFVMVESEHSAISAAVGASACGARVCTATASQGVALMHEILFIAAGMRLPIVMAIGNRALSAPINIWCDHQDTIASRDVGWMQFYAERNQEGLDLMIMAFKIAEDPRVMLPATVGIDAFVLTHTMEAVDVPEQKDVDEFLPPLKLPYVLDVKKPMTFGSFGTPEYYPEFKYAQTKAIEDSAPVIDEVFKQFEEKFGRKYQKVSTFMCEDADIVLVSMGSMTGTAREAVKKMRAEGKKVGLVKMTVFRPFPAKELVDATKSAKVVAIIERNISPGFGGAIFGELSAQYVNEDKKPLLADYIIGLGGRDVLISDFEEITNKCNQIIYEGKVRKPVEWIGLNKELLEGE